MNRLRLTDSIAGATFLAWVLGLLSGQYPGIATWAGFIPARVIGQYHLLHAVPMLLTPLSATLVHGGLFHVLFNCIILVYCGRQVEEILGARWLGVLYLLGAYVSCLAQFAVNIHSDVPMIGASGAISALVGAYAVLFSRSQAAQIGPIPAHFVRALWLGVAWVALQAMAGWTMQESGYSIAVAAHIGGFLVGLLLGRPMLAHKHR
jgi:membrane associated rhomboid family serine protease